MKKRHVVCPHGLINYGGDNMNTITLKTRNNHIITLHNVTIDAYAIYGYDNNNKSYTIPYQSIKTAQYTIL